jgi:Tfp pilus assembly protein FimT
MKKSFSFIELLIILAIISVTIAGGMAINSGMLVRGYVKNTVNELVSTLRTAQNNSMNAKASSAWGVKITSSQIIMFKGGSYVPPGTAFDQKYDIPQSITVSQTEIVFNKLTGNPNQTATISVASNMGESHVISVNRVGTVDVD